MGSGFSITLNPAMYGKAQLPTAYLNGPQRAPSGGGIPGDLGTMISNVLRTAGVPNMPTLPEYYQGGNNGGLLAEFSNSQPSNSGGWHFSNSHRQGQDLGGQLPDAYK